MGGLGQGGLGNHAGFGGAGGFQGGASVPAAVPHEPRPRDERLNLFGQGQWADDAPGSAWLALQADDVSRPEVLAQATTSEVLGIGRSWKALETWTFSRKLAVVRELIRRHPLNECREPGGLPSEWTPELHHEVAAALGFSPVTAGKLVRLAWTLDTRLPGIGQALEENRLDPARARLIVDGTSVLDDERKLAMAERIILDGLPRCRTWSALERLVERAVISVDPDGAKRRREKAEQEHARLRFWRESCGTCAIQGVGLPADEALAAMAHIEGRVREYQEAGIKRPVDILRVMAFADLINGVTVRQRAAWSHADAAARDAQEPNHPRERNEAEKAQQSQSQPPQPHQPQQLSLPGRVNLTVPAAALEWLAEWSSEHAETPACAGPRPTCGNHDDGSMAVRQDLVFPLLTLLGLADRPGEAYGLGSLDAALVRELTAAVGRHPDSRFCLTVTDDHGHAIGHGCCKPLRGASPGDVTTRPDRATITHSGRAGPDGGFGSWILTVPGVPLPFVVDIDPVPTYDCDHRFESARHDPGAKLRHLVQVRDGTCSFPVCARHARESDFEHAVAFHQGGRTCACNAHACSRSCHRAKQSRGWQVTKPRPGWTRWTTKAGRTYLQGPWRYPS
ncbi:MAG TPA: DUF222 domain-containing protein [Trebonia sp.]|nr:DUF222 domain-containing protein [Trebonia sp.]